jgi:hypothetical protein
MRLTSTDWAVIVAYLLLNLVIALFTIAAAQVETQRRFSWVAVTFLTAPESYQTLISFTAAFTLAFTAGDGSQTWFQSCRMFGTSAATLSTGFSAFPWCTVASLALEGDLWGMVLGFLLALAAISGYLIFWDLSRRG